MPPRKLRWRKIASDNSARLNIKFFDDIKKETHGFEKEAFIRRIITKLTINPELSNLWFSLGLLLSEAELYELANEVFDKVVTLNPDHKKLWTSKANVLRNLGRHDEASDCYKKSLESFTGQLDGYNNLSDLQEEIKERRAELGLEDFDDESIEYLTTNILDLDSFIAELETLTEIEENDKAQAAADGFSDKLDELENMGRSRGKILSSLFGSKKNEEKEL
jgi:tetratricopeptide (TPR) repeat protein